MIDHSIVVMNSPLCLALKKRLIYLVVMLFLSFYDLSFSQEMRECTVKGREITSIKSVKLNEDDTVSIIHSAGIARYPVDDLDEGFIKSWGIQSPSPPNEEGEEAGSPPDEVEVEPGLQGGYRASYEFSLKRVMANEMTRWDAGGNVEITIRGNGIMLYFWNRDSPTNDNPDYRGQFPAQGPLILSEAQIPTFVKYMNKFLEWDEVSESQGLKDIDKSLGVLGGCDYDYHRSANGQGWCSIMPNFDELDDSMSFREKINAQGMGHITVFRPAAVVALHLVGLKDKLREEKLSKEEEKLRLQKKADDLLK